MHESHERTDPASALESAAGYLRRSLSADGGAHGGGPRRGQIEWQFDCLYRWAKAKARLGDSQALKQARRGGREHDVLLHEPSGRFWKFTIPARAGLSFAVHRANEQVVAVEVDATPLEYFERLLRLHEIFGVETRLEALIIHQGQPRIATSQPFVKGCAPTVTEIRRMMRDFDFQKSPRGQAFYRKADGITVWDAHVGNFLKSGGTVVPIDVICLPASPLMVEALGF